MDGQPQSWQINIPAPRIGHSQQRKHTINVEKLFASQQKLKQNKELGPRSGCMRILFKR